mmetsp:Transcript_32766/g.34104  ORF Transcript_32766/g.34104 Transcript_32766/m.34104 type:complete len:228 (+) Transcript_32766:25-708(+)
MHCFHLTMNSSQQEKKKEFILHEKYRPTSFKQDFGRLLIILIHFYYFTWIVHTWGVSVKLVLFLTILSFFTNLVYYISVLGNSIIHSVNEGQLIRQCVINTIFRVGFVVSNVVIILYWGIYLVDPLLLGDQELEFHFDIFLHGGNLLFLVIDKIAIDREHRYEKRINSKVLFWIALCYFVYIYSVYLATGLAIYPLLAKLNVIGLFCLFIAGYTLFLAGNVIYKLII